MSEHPILFSGPMIRAILEGRKTQTRRPIRDAAGAFWDHSGWRAEVVDGRVAWFVADPGGVRSPYGPSPRCPYGKPGDRLWVREAFASYRGCSEPCSPGKATYAVLPDGTQIHKGARIYKPAKNYEPGAFDGIKWRPSIHMPRWASRITLEVTEVRVQRLREITCVDAAAEGMPTGDPLPPLTAFRLLWDTINGKRAPWSSNPWVWAVSFRLVRP